MAKDIKDEWSSLVHRGFLRTVLFWCCGNSLQYTIIILHTHPFVLVQKLAITFYIAVQAGFELYITVPLINNNQSMILNEQE